MGPGRGTAALREWVLEQVEKGKAKTVDRKYYTPEPAAEGPAGAAGRAPRGGGPGGMGGFGGGGTIYDLRPDLGLKEATE